MGKQIAEDRRFTRMKSLSLSRLLPDTCKIKRITLSSNYYNINSSGSFYPLSNTVDSEASSYITYDASENIPCRIQKSRFLRDEEIFDQESVVNQYIFHLPHDLSVQADDLIVISDREYSLLDILDVADWSATTVCTIADIRMGDKI